MKITTMFAYTAILCRWKTRRGARKTIDKWTRTAAGRHGAVMMGCRDVAGGNGGDYVEVDDR